MDVAVVAIARHGRLVEARNQRADLRQLGRIGGTNQHRVAARLGQDGGAKTGVRLACCSACGGLQGTAGG